MTELRLAAETPQVSEGLQRALAARRRINRLVHGIDTDRRICTRSGVAIAPEDQAAA